MTLEELYKNPVFANAMSELSETERQQTEKDISSLLSRFNENLMKPLTAQFGEDDGVG